MPLVEYSLHVLRAVALRHRADLPVRRRRALTLSHPDVVALPARVEEIIGLPPGSLPLRPDAAGAVAWHKAFDITRELVDTAALFAVLGYDMTALDKVEGRGGEVLVDLSEPLGPEHREAYDLVYDCISNQVFNVAACMANAAYACKVGGYVFHTIPVQMVNQGFWSVSPAAYHDFYPANGFEILTFDHVVGVYAEKARVELDRDRRVRNVPDDTMNVVVARKLRHVEPPVWPMMTKFVKHPTCTLPTDNVKPPPGTPERLAWEERRRLREAEREAEDALPGH